MGMAASPAPATPAPPQSASETQFVQRVSRDLQGRFATTEAAAKAGYFRYTDEDDTGAISWVNPKHWTSDPEHPSQLWYDVKGRLIGADFSVPKADSSQTPSLWGIDPKRWGTFTPHVHFGVKGSGDTIAFGGAGPKTLARVGSTLDKATSEDVVKLGKAQSADQVVFLFAFPAIWDLQVWLVPNPLGAFAEHNPNVVPAKALPHAT